MKKLKLTVGAKTDKGNVKQVNQDALLYKIGSMDKSEFGLFVVCDGLGGLEYGEVASSKTVEYFEEWWNTTLKSILKNKDNENLIRVSLEEVLLKSNKELLALSNEINSNVGTTASALFILNNNYYIVHIGDSRIYEVNKKMIQLTEDHSQYEMLRKQGIKNLQNVKKNVLTQCIGVNEKLEIFYKKGKINKNTNFLICSDGLHNKMDEEGVINKFNNKDSKAHEAHYLQQICENLIDEVKENKERDNITALVINVRKKRNKIRNKGILLGILVALLCLGGGMAVVKLQKGKEENKKLLNDQEQSFDISSYREEKEILTMVLDILQEIDPNIVDNFKEKYKEKVSKNELSDEIKKILEPLQEENQGVNNQASYNMNDTNSNSEEVISYKDKKELKTLIQKAQALHDRSVEGNKNDQYKVNSKYDLQEAINKAKDIYEQKQFSKNIIDDQIGKLKNAIEVFESNKNKYIEPAENETLMN